jgi:hypothetical protein
MPQELGLVAPVEPDVQSGTCAEALKFEKVMQECKDGGLWKWKRCQLTERSGL